ncbi:hypothetical protein VUR80DRAFT_3795 [Thermomyces stellatus]
MAIWNINSASDLSKLRPSRSPLTTASCVRLRPSRGRKPWFARVFSMGQGPRTVRLCQPLVAGRGPSWVELTVVRPGGLPLARGPLAGGLGEGGAEEGCRDSELHIVSVEMGDVQQELREVSGATGRVGRGEERSSFIFGGNTFILALIRVLEARGPVFF